MNSAPDTQNSDNTDNPENADIADIKSTEMDQKAEDKPQGDNPSDEAAAEHVGKTDDSVAGQAKSEDLEIEQELHAADAEDMQLQLIAAQEEIVKLKDAFLRAKAEEDNVRRRSEKEVANSRKFAVESFAKEMLNVRDSLQLAKAVELPDDADDSIKGMLEGLEITLKQLDSGFAKFALVEIRPEVGDKLDPNLHQAMSMIESQDVDPGCILNVIQSGFQMHDRLLRPAMVVVAK